MRHFISVLACCLLFICMHSSAQNPKKYKKAWAEIDSLESIGLPKSAKEKTLVLQSALKKDNQMVEQIKCLIYLSKYNILTEETQDDQPIAREILRFETELKNYQGNSQAILHTYLGKFYASYLDENQWKLIERKSALNYASTDITTWSAEQLFSKAEFHYRNALTTFSNPNQPLKELSILVADNLDGNGQENYSLCPTVFDLVMQQTLDFYKNERNFIRQPASQFHLDKAAYYAPVNSFLNLTLPKSDTSGNTLKICSLYQQVLRFHLKDASQELFAQYDFERIQWVKSKILSSVPDTFYVAALKDFVVKYAKHPICTEGYASLAQYYQNKGASHLNKKNNPYFKQALPYCEKAISLFPKSIGAQTCKAIQHDIESPYLGLMIEKSVMPQEASLVRVEYKNLAALYCKIVQINQNSAFNNFFSEEEVQDDIHQKISKLVKQKEVFNQTYKLNNPLDFEHHSTEIAVPGLPAGKYAIILSSTPNFTTKENVICYQIYTATQISYLSKPDQKKGNTQFIVLHRKTGEPLADVTVEFYQTNYNNKTGKRKLTLVSSTVTDKEGNTLAPTINTSLIPKFIKGQDILFDAESFSSYVIKENIPPDHYTVSFFTDRAIYRPGQTIYFKGILLQHSYKKQPVIAANKSVTISFHDVNYQLISELNLTSNEFGSIAGTFVIPTDKLNGQMSLQANIGGQTYIRVEEYKRPQFEVLHEPLQEGYVLNDSIVLSGKAISFSGVGLDKATVQYTVTRKISFPYWKYGWWDRMFPIQENSVVLNTGTTKTDASGKFTVPFRALVDPSMDSTLQALYVYDIQSHVTDITGETHSYVSTLRLSHTGIETTVEIPDMLTIDSALKIKVSAMTLNGAFEKSKCILQIQSLKQNNRFYQKRLWEMPDYPILTKEEFKDQFPQFPFAAEHEYAQWDTNGTLYTETFFTEENKTLSLLALKSLPAGVYKVIIQTFDKKGHQTTITHYVTTYQFGKKSIPTKEILFLGNNYNQGTEIIDKKIQLLSPLDKVYVLFELRKNSNIVFSQRIQLVGPYIKLLDSFLLSPGRYDYSFYTIYNNRFYKTDGLYLVPEPSTELSIGIENFRNKLLPGEKESWNIKISGPQKEKVTAEIVASLYDKSLDQFIKHEFNNPLMKQIPSSYFIDWQAHVTQAYNGFDYSFFSGPNLISLQPTNQPSLNIFGYPLLSYGRMERYYGVAAAGVMADAAMNTSKTKMAAPKKRNMKAAKIEKDVLVMDEPAIEEKEEEEDKKEASTSLEKVSVRTNLKETVFFYPQLRTDSLGNTILQFTMNEALTKWKLLLYAHTQSMYSGMVEKEIITQKDLMITPHAPRFLRQGDTLFFTSKVSNQSDQLLNTSVFLKLNDPITEQSILSSFQVDTATQHLILEPRQSKAVSWRLIVPHNLYSVQYSVIAAAEKYSDGESSALPILTNQMLVTESMPIALRGGQSKSFKFKSISDKINSSTLRTHQYTLEFTSNPVWYAVQALPYIMEYPHECTEQIFSRYYANTIAAHVTQKFPTIQKVFDQWKNNDQLQSNLFKNESLKSALLQETPWIAEAQSESQKKQNIALLFDLNKMGKEEKEAQEKIISRQNADGGFSWFPGAQSDRYISQYILEGFGHLGYLKVNAYEQNEKMRTMLQKGVVYIDEQIAREYELLEKSIKQYGGKLTDNHLSYTATHYLYTRSFYAGLPLPDRTKKAFQYYVGQSKKYWFSQNNYSKGMIALTLKRNKELETANQIVKSLKENAFVNEELGMYWKNNYGYRWYEMPIETQSLMIEVFNEVGQDMKAVDDLKIWLLKNKQTNAWKTTKATASAVYALLLTGESYLEVPKNPDITVGNQNFDFSGVQTEAGSGYFKKAWNAESFQPTMANISVKNNNANIAWGAAYWQYFENLDKIKSFKETPLKITKNLFKEIQTSNGIKLNPIESSAVQPGDKILVRVILTVDREMEYIHLKDMRASGLEPANVLSYYKYQEGLGYYESTKDAATHFFFDHLPKGTYVFEYPLIASHSGIFSNGITTIQSMYAPEFTSHSNGQQVIIQELTK